MRGNVRQNPKFSGTTHNVFGIQVGVGITVAIRRAGGEKFLKYHRMAEDLTRMSKIAMLTEWRSLTGVPWNDLQPNTKNAWITEGLQADFEGFLPIASKEAKASKSGEVQAIFKTYSLGVSTNRDSVVYDYNPQKLEARVSQFLTAYNSEVSRWIDAGYPADIDAFLNYSEIKWSRNLKSQLKRKRKAVFDNAAMQPALYRPYDKEWLYRGDIAVDEAGATGSFLPTAKVQLENLLICLSNPGNNKSFHALMTNCLPDLHLTGDTQCFPLYTYALDGKIRRDNITDWALAQFRAKYGPDVTKPDIFHYVYALLHHPEYRARYKENLKRELPRVPLVEDGPHPRNCVPTPAPARGRGVGEETGGEEAGGDIPYRNPSPVPGEGSERSSGGGGVFRAFAAAGENLAALHIGYEQADEYPLTWVETEGAAFSWRVTKMRLSADKAELKVNAGLTLSGIPPEAFEYRLGNRSALEWVLDQYQVSTDKRSGIGSDPNRDDDPEYIVRLVGRVVTVSVETVRIVAGMPALGLGGAGSAGETA